MRSHWHYVHGCVWSIALALLVIGCTSRIESNDDSVDTATEALADVAPDMARKEAYPRYVAARGAFTCELTLTGDSPPGQVPPDLERDRMVMSRECGLIVKYLPIAFDPQGTTHDQPNLLSGGRYLFKTAKQAERYHDFVENDFALDGAQFLDRDIFLASECHHYAVLHAYELTPLHDTHVLIRVERFAMTGSKPVKQLEAVWPQLQREAADRGMAASLAYLTNAPALGHFLESLGWART